MNRHLPGLAVALLACLSLSAQENAGADKTAKPEEKSPAAHAENAEALRKAAQNPVASLISVPVQNNFNFNVAPDGRVQDVLNIQPVIPSKLSENWNLITRIITPIVYQPLPAVPGQPTEQGAYGFGDLNPTFFFSPSKPSKIIWGAGPAFVLPTGTNKFLGQGKWSAGPALVVLTQPGHWTLGVLTNNVWSFAGQSDRVSVNQFLLQYFINYNLKKGYYITWQPTLTSNWEVSGPNRWTVPFGGGIGRIMRLGFQPVNLALQFYANPIRPPGSSSWSMRMQIAFLFPKGRPK
jgi:hypothetical protein